MICSQKTQLGLQGAFKVDIFNVKDELVESTNYFSNFITQTGLFYPSRYSFPDCFRFLSLGQGTIANSATGNAGAFRNPTTGLQDPVNSNGLITASDGTFQSVLYMGRNYYYGGTDGACGSIVTKQGPIYYRGWSVPTGGKLTNSAISINEFMVSPSSGQDVSGKCAFSRVVRSVIIPANSRSIISYQLQVRILNTGVTVFNSGTFITGQANVDNDLGIVSEWQNLSGYYKQIHHGLRLIDVEGSTYVPKYGDGMEPSLKNVNLLKTYFSPDNSQFDVSTTGANQQSETSAYAADGLSKVYFGQSLSIDAGRASEEDSQYYAQGDLPITALPATDPNDPISNIRYKEADLPSLENYNDKIDDVDYSTPTNNFLTKTPSISIATPGATGYNSELVDIGDKAVSSALTINLPFTYSGKRTQRITRKQFFAPVNSLGHNSRFGSFVVAYKNGGTYWPYVDSLLYDNSGRATMQHYRKFSGVQLTHSGSGVLAGNIRADRGFQRWTGELLTQNGTVTGITPLSGVEDFGLVNHSLTDNTPPSSTGVLWYPHYGLGRMNTEVPDITYSNSGLTITDPNNYFKTGGQMVNNLVFSPVAKDNWSVSKDYAWAHRFANQNPQLSGDSSTYWNGLYLTTVQYTGSDTLETGTLIEDTFESEIGLGSNRYSSLRITGYLGKRGDITPMCANGTVTLTGLPSTYLSTFTPNVAIVNAQFRSGASNKITQAIRIQDIFSGNNHLTQRLSGINYTYNSGAYLSFGVTGLVYDNAVSSWKSVYVSQMSGNYLLSPGYQWVGNSYHTGEVLFTRFVPPTGYFVHEEAKRLLPNHAIPTYSGDDYSNVSFGGTYPALSFDNTLELYLDILWSATCGTALDCEEPS
jgi:hypothetical protein